MASLYYENAMGRLYAHPADYALLRYSPGPRTLVDVQGILTHTGRLLHLRGWQKLLSDQRQLRPFSEQEQALILQYWHTRSHLYGPVTGAVVVAQDVFTRLSFSRIRHEAQQALRYRLFEQEAEAAAWLAQLPEAGGRRGNQALR